MFFVIWFSQQPYEVDTVSILIKQGENQGLNRV